MIKVTSGTCEVLHVWVTGLIKCLNVATRRNMARCVGKMLSYNQFVDKVRDLAYWADGERGRSCWGCAGTVGVVAKRRTLRDSGLI